MKAHRVLVALLALFALTASACGSDPATGTAEPAPAVSEAQPAAGEEETASEMTALEAELYEAAQEEGMFAWWDNHDLDAAHVVIDAFKARYPGVEVEYLLATDDEVLERYLLERQAGQNTADLFPQDRWFAITESGAPTNVADLVEDTGYDEQLMTTEGDGVQVTFSAWGVAYNTNLVDEADVPTSWEDLLDPKYQGRMVMEARLKNFIAATDIPAYEGKHEGLWEEEWIVDYLEGLQSQELRFETGGTPTVTLVAAGESPMAIGIYLAVVEKLKGDGAPVEFAPLDKTIAEAAAFYTVPDDAPHPDAARLFLRWLMTEEGQRLVDEVLDRGNPFPESGTETAAFLESIGSTPVVGGPELYEGDTYQRLEQRYLEAMGLTAS